MSKRIVKKVSHVIRDGLLDYNPADGDDYNQWVCDMVADMAVRRAEELGLKYPDTEWLVNTLMFQQVDGRYCRLRFVAIDACL